MTPPSPVRAALAVVGLAAVLVAGVLVLGTLASTDVAAVALTTGFFVAVAAALAVVVRRRRSLLLPLAATYVVVTGTCAVLLGLPLVTDDVVREDVVRVGAPPTAGSSAGAGSPGPTADVPVALASGPFAARAHPGEGVATLVRTGGGTVLTLTGFATDNGPDLFVYLVPAAAAADSVDGAVDLGRLKGNVGDQQYTVPDGVAAGAGWRVVVWCRAFSANFTEATLA